MTAVVFQDVIKCPCMSVLSVVKCKLRKVRKRLRKFNTKGDHILEENKIISEEELTEDNAASEENEKKELYSRSELEELVKAQLEPLIKKLEAAEKLAAAPESERSDLRREQLEKELADREAAVAKRELMADAVEKLTAAGLPKQLADCLDYSGREECSSSLETVARAFQNALTAAVNERIRGRAPKLAPSGSNDAFLDGLGM